MHAYILFALLAAAWHCMPLLCLSSTRTSRSFSILDSTRGSPPSVSIAFIFLPPKSIILHFSTLNLICHVVAHSIHLFRSFCKVSTFCEEVIALLSLVLSANTEIELFTPFSRIGLSTEPWGTPLPTPDHYMYSPFITTL